MNIMFQVGSWHFQKGGSDLFVRTISYWLAKRGHKVVVLAHRLEEEKCGDEDIKIGKGIIKIRYTPSQRKGIRFNPLIYAYRLMITSSHLYNLAKEEDVDVIVVGETELLSVLPLKLLRTKIACRGGALLYETMSKEIIKERGKGVYSSAFILLIKLYNLLTLKLPDVMIPVNKAEYDFMKLHKRRNAGIEIIPHGVDIRLFKPTRKKKTGKLTVGYAGRLAPIKYPEVVLEIFKDALKHTKNTEFIWVGPLAPSAGKNYFEELKKKIGIRNARHIGQVKNEELPKVLGRFDVFLQAEQQKNVSRSTTEAAACGLPIVALNIGKELYGFFTMDKEKAKNELRKLATNIDYRTSAGNKARKIIEDNFSEDKIYEKYARMFKEIAGK